MAEREMSRRTFLKIAGLSTLGLLAACAPQALPTATPSTAKEAEPEEPAEPAPAQKVKITAWDLVAEDATGASVFEGIKQQWFAEANPDIEVEHLPFPSVTVENRREYWVTALSTEGGPSVVNFDSNSFTYDMASMGYILFLDDYLPLYYPEFDSLLPIMQESSKYDGKVIQIPGGVELNGLAVRRDYQEEAGYDPDFIPRSWDEWVQLCKDLTTDDHWGFQWPMIGWGYSIFLGMNGGTVALQKDDNTITLHYTDDAVVETAEWYRDLVYRHQVTAPDTFADFGTNLNNFQQGLAATFNFMPSWLNWLFGTATFQPEQLNFIPCPMGPSGMAGTSLIDPWVGVGSISYAVNARQGALERDASARYICFMRSQENMRKQAEWWRENEMQGVFASPFADMPWNEVSVGVPEWWGQPLIEMLEFGGMSPAPDFAGGDYLDKALDEIMRDPNSDIVGELRKAEERCQAEFLDDYMAGLMSG